MVRKAKPRPLAGGAGAGTVDQAAERVGLPSASQTPARKVKYFGDRAASLGAAVRLVTSAFSDPNCNKLRVFTIPDRPNDELPDGVSAAEVCFDRSQFDDAVRWTAGCLNAGWKFFRRRRS